MHLVSYHKRAQKALRSIPSARARSIVESINRIADLDDPTSDSNVRMMTGEWHGSWRLRVGEYRVIFDLTATGEGDAELVVFLTHIGSRGGIY